MEALNKKTKAILIFILFSIFQSCDILFPDEKLSMDRKDYIGNELRTDGYYYYFTKNDHTVVYFLYKNGIIVCAHSYSTHNLNFVENEMVKIYPEIRKQKDGWGVFAIDGNKIEYEIWNTSTGFSLPTIRSTGYIKNDTTFCITESYYSDMKTTEKKETIFRFKQFDNKLDSTNIYIK